MKMKSLYKIFFLSVISVFIFDVSLFAADKGNFVTSPKTNNGMKWRIGYYEGGEYPDYQMTIIATVNGLIGLGWIEKTVIPPQQGKQTKDLWNWLSGNIKSNYIEFVKDAHYNANWDKTLRPQMASEIIKRLNEKKDMDLMIVAGTWGGQDIANGKHHIPTLVVSTADPIKAGIIKSAEDSGFEHVHARVDPFRWERQIKLFHDIVKFKKLGVAYENTETGKVYGSIDKVEKVAKERGFEIVSCYTKSDVSDLNIAEESVKKCFEELGRKKVDAIYVTVQIGVNSKSIPDLVKVGNSYKIPTFSQLGSEEVRYGFLMSVAKTGFKDNGVFHANTIAKIFNGAKPRQLDQVFESPLKLAINYKTSEVIKFDLPMDFLETVDEVYKDIAVPEKK